MNARLENHKHLGIATPRLFIATQNGSRADANSFGFICFATLCSVTSYVEEYYILLVVNFAFLPMADLATHKVPVCTF